MAAVVRARSRSLDAFHQREGLPTSCKPLSAEKDGPATGNLDGILLVRRTVSVQVVAGSSQWRGVVLIGASVAG